MFIFMMGIALYLFIGVILFFVGTFILHPVADAYKDKIPASLAEWTDFTPCRTVLTISLLMWPVYIAGLFITVLSCAISPAISAAQAHISAELKRIKKEVNKYYAGIRKKPRDGRL